MSSSHSSFTSPSGVISVTVAIILIASPLVAVALDWKEEFMKLLLTETGPVFLMENAAVLFPPRNILTSPFLITGAAIGMKRFFVAIILVLALVAALLLRAAYFMEGVAADMVTFELEEKPDATPAYIFG